MNDNLVALNLGTIRGRGILGFENGTLDSAPSIFNNTISTILGIMTAIAFIWFTLQFILAIIAYMTSGGDKAAVEAAKKRITTNLIGLVLIIAGISVISLIGFILGIDILGGTSVVNQLK